MFKIEIKEKPLFNKETAVPVALIVKVRNEGQKNLYTYCNRCGEPTSHLRTSEAVQCIKCSQTRKLRVHG